MRSGLAGARPNKRLLLTWVAEVERYRPARKVGSGPFGPSVPVGCQVLGRVARLAQRQPTQQNRETLASAHRLV